MSKYKLVLFFFALPLLTHCSLSEYELATDYNEPQDSEFNLFVIPEQKVPVEYIRSIQFHRSGSANNPPILRLNTAETLQLSFDAISNEAQQFRVEFSHRNLDWSKSNLPIEQFIQGLPNFYITGGSRSRYRDVSYFHYETTFPDRGFKFLVSGNYLLRVYDTDTNKEIYTLPFFIHENTGRISSKTEVVFNNTRDGRAQEQLFSIYQHPAFVQFPQFDLSFRFAQNKLWGNSKKPDAFDTSVEGEVEFHLVRNQLYKADFEFNILDLENLRNTNNILDFDPSSEPQKVVLKENVQNFSAIPIPVRQSKFGLINSDRASRYIATSFSLIPRRKRTSTSDIYLTGDFNQWQIQPEYKLNYDPVSTLWKVEALIKQGVYAYKYVELTNNRVEAFQLDDGFTRQQQEYTSFIYYLDPNRQYYRLLQAQVFTGE